MLNNNNNILMSQCWVCAVKKTTEYVQAPEQVFYSTTETLISCLNGCGGFHVVMSIDPGNHLTPKLAMSSILLSSKKMLLTIILQTHCDHELCVRGAKQIYYYTSNWLIEHTIKKYIERINAKNVSLKPKYRSNIKICPFLDDFTHCSTFVHCELRV